MIVDLTAFATRNTSPFTLGLCSQSLPVSVP